jgi:hypothetical protein
MSEMQDDCGKAMKKYLFGRWDVFGILFVICFTTLVLLFVGCGSRGPNADLPVGLIHDPDSVINTGPRLWVRSDLFTKDVRFWIVEDNLTGCQYMVARDISYPYPPALAVTPLRETCKDEKNVGH